MSQCVIFYFLVEHLVMIHVDLNISLDIQLYTIVFLTLIPQQRPSLGIFLFASATCEESHTGQLDLDPEP